MIRKIFVVFVILTILLNILFFWTLHVPASSSSTSPKSSSSSSSTSSTSTSTKKNKKLEEKNIRNQQEETPNFDWFSANILSKPKYSSNSLLKSNFHCIGSDRISSRDKERVCNFENICYSRKKKKFVFFSDPDIPSPITVIDGNKMKRDFPPKFIRLRDQNWFTLEIRNELINSSRVRFDNEASLYAVIMPFWPENFGHVLCDDFFSIFSAQLLFRKLTSDIKILSFYKCHDFFSINSNEYKRCNIFYSDWLKGISRHPLCSLDSIHHPISKDESVHDDDDDDDDKHNGSGAVGNNNDNDQEDLICYHNVIAGFFSLRMISLLSLNSGIRWSIYREYFMTNIGMNPQFKPSKQKILLVNKKGRRRILNPNDIIERLKRFQVPIHYQNDWHDLSPKEQIEIIQSCTVQITPPGGISMASFFLSPGSVSIFLDYFNKPENLSESMEGHLWSHIPYFDQYRYLVEDREIIVEPNNEESLWGSYRNFGNYMIDTGKMESLVFDALSHVERNNGWKDSFNKENFHKKNRN